jgi:hypothetical protein
MDYILRKINQEIAIRHDIHNDKNEESQFLRIKIEYLLLLILGYLWNKNFTSLKDEGTKQFIIQ